MSDEKIKLLQKQIEQINKSIQGLSGEARTPLFKEFAESYLAEKLSNPTFRQATKRSFQNQLNRHLIPAFGLLHLDRISNAEWLGWINRKRNGVPTSGCQPFIFFNSRKALVELLNAAKEAGHIDKIPKLDNPDQKTDVGRVLSEKEAIEILWKARRPFRFIFYCFWKMGCRPQEILRWEWSMIRWNEPGHTWIDIPARISKTDRSRSIPLNPDVSRLLRRRFLRGNGSPFVFPARGNTKAPQLSYQSAWKRACALAGVLKAVVYDFRRTFITKCAADGQPLIYVAKALDTSTKMIENTYAKAQVDVMERIIK